MDWFQKKFFYLEIRWGFQIRYRNLPQMTLWTTKSNFLVYWPISTRFFSFNWKFIWDSKSEIVVYLKCRSEPLKPNFLVYGMISTKFFSFNWKILTWNNCLIIINFAIMILWKINFNIIWYSEIFAANNAFATIHYNVCS